MTPGTTGLKNPLRDSQAEAPACYCRRCCGELYGDETLYTWDGEEICPDCFEEVITLWVRKTPDEVANALGVSMRKITRGE